MWFFIKLTISGFAFLVRYFGKSFPQSGSGFDKVVSGTKININKKTNKDRVILTDFTIQFECRSVFKLSAESSLDRFFKSFGISDEVQTGDSSFDILVYVASDSSAFREKIRMDVKSRELILELFRAGCEWISCNGKILRCRFKKDVSDNETLLTIFENFHKQLLNIDKTWNGFFSDPFALKILIVEACIWFVASYAFIGFFEWTIRPEDIFFDKEPIVWQGLFWGVIAAVILLGVIVVLMKGSSRGHRILTESFFVLFLSLPAGGISAVADINTQFDLGASTLVEAQVKDLYTVEHRGRRGKVSYTYHIRIESLTKNISFLIPQSLKINRDLYLSLAKEKFIKIEVGDGRLRHRWIRSIIPLR